MSKRTTHPPGPYTVEYLGEDTLTGIAFGYDIPGAGSPVGIGWVYFEEKPDGPGDISVSQGEAIARLWAASPDLFAACELWDQGFKDGDEFTPEQLLKWVNDNRRAARAAIAKVKGESS